MRRLREALSKQEVQRLINEGKQPIEVVFRNHDTGREIKFIAEYPDDFVDSKGKHHQRLVAALNARWYRVGLQRKKGQMQVAVHPEQALAALLDYCLSGEPWISQDLDMEEAVNNFISAKHSGASESELARLRIRLREEYLRKRGVEYKDENKRRAWNRKFNRYLAERGPGETLRWFLTDEDFMEDLEGSY